MHLHRRQFLASSVGLSASALLSTASAAQPSPARAGAGGAAPRLVHVSWSEDPATTLSVTWHVGPAPAPSFLVSGAQRVAASFSPGLNGDTIARATLRGLAPGTVHRWRIEPAGTEPTAWRETRTAPAGRGAKVRLLFFGDTGLIGRPDGNATGTAAFHRLVKTHDPLLVLGGGDYAYADKDGRFPKVADAVDRWFEDAQPWIADTPLLAQYGNHEIVLRERFEDWGPRFTHPPGTDDGQCFSLDVGPLHVAAFFAPRPNLPKPHLDWLDADLAAARARGMPWLCVMQHEPIFGHGNSHPSNFRVTALVAPILERHRVDLHLSAHDQNYERTFPLREVPHETTVVNRSLDDYPRGTGVVYAKVSPAGKRSEIGGGVFSRFLCRQQRFIARRNDTTHHFAVFEVSREELSFTAYALPEDTLQPREFDRFRIRASA